MLILGIETSCDDTAVAVLRVENGKLKVKSNVVSSQVKLHAKYGGVFPSLAAREHEKNLPKVLKLALKEAGVRIGDADLIAVTKGPGLEPSLWRGINFANDLAKKFKKPILGVNHLEGHIYSNWLPLNKNGKSAISPTLDPRLFAREFSSGNMADLPQIFPALNLIVSGGHTELVLMKNHGQYKIIGETMDDAVGEAFDKVARMLNLGYPGGPVVALRASKFRSKSAKIEIKFPRPMMHSKDFNFSFSGLKTAVLYKVREIGKLSPAIINQICYEFQEAAIDVLVSKTIKAAQKYKIKSVMLSGGVSANKSLRKSLEIKVGLELKKVKFFKPEPNYTTDNAAMIALAGYIEAKSVKRKAKNRRKNKTGWKPVKVDANLNFS